MKPIDTFYAVTSTFPTVRRYNFNKKQINGNLKKTKNGKRQNKKYFDRIKISTFCSIRSFLLSLNYCIYNGNIVLETFNS